MRIFRLSRPGLTAGVLLSFAAMTHAWAGDMPGSEIRKAVAGKTVYVSTSAGTLPIRYSSNGTMHARAPAIASITGPSKDSGSWWVSGQRLCQKWKIWLKGKTHCVTLRRRGKKLVWTESSGRTGVARITSAR